MRRDRLASFVGALLGALLIAGIVWGGGLANGPYVSSVNKVSRSGDTMTGALDWSGGAETAPANGVYLVGTNNLAIASTNTNFNTSGTLRWQITSTGSFVAGADNSYDIGNAATRIGQVYAIGFDSYAASGSNAFSVATNGARIDFGGGASDYASSDGTTVAFAGAVSSASSFTVLSGGYVQVQGTGIQDGHTGAAIRCGFSTGDTCAILNEIGAAAATSAIPAFLFNQDNGALGASDLLFDFRDNQVSKFKLDASGNGTFAAGATATQLIATSPGGANAIVATGGAFQNTSGVGSTGQYLRSGGASASTTWQTLYANWSADCIGATLTTACSEDGNFTGSVKAISAWTNSRVSCSWNTAGTGGTTGVVVQVYDVTAAGEICHCTLGACTTAANVPLACDCAGAYVTGNQYTLRLTSATDCAGDPADLDCNVTYSQ